ncbi:flavodoxin family protein [Desulfonatronovibrio hydrogenovorans]|uniref:flavodoxin family protein n=1 Tax=Desulfonatronovibrio hydrogenovorans TaxID=53245 RepID=UPI000691C0C9|nr:flavodoxin family protein [Desulfonatronovibrio hydrogenovorans]
MNFIHQDLKKKISSSCPEPRVLGVGASPRKGGNSDLLLHEALKGAGEKKIRTAALQLRNLKFSPCIGCEKCRKEKICTGHMDGMSLVYPAVYQSLGLVLVSPTHNYNITAWMKAFIDRLYCFYDFEDTRPRQWSTRLSGHNRKALLIAIAEQEAEFDMGFTLDAMQRPLEALGYDIVGRLPVFGIFDRAGVNKDREVLARARMLGLELAGALSSQKTGSD